MQSMTAGTSRKRTRVGAIAATVAAAVFAAGAAGSSGAERPVAKPLMGAAAPTSAEVRAATRRFLAGTAKANVPAPPGGEVGTAAARRRSILPQRRVVSFYGAPQLSQTIVGRYGPAQAGKRLRKQANAYKGANRRPVTPAFDLIGVIATADRGSDGKYRTRQSPQIINTYLARARKLNARLMLDIQPGRANVLGELKALRRWAVEPDVDLAIDPEWNVGRKGVPGRTSGSITAKRVNRFSLKLQKLIAGRGLPPKILVLHQFHSRSVRNPKRIRDRRDVDIVLNFDGIGSPKAKAAGYANLSTKRLHNGFSLFYSRDKPVMKPGAVLRLEPEPDFLLYQ